MPLATPTVYIPTLSGGERLASCLAAMERQTAVVEVVVADNGSGEGCSGMLKSRFPLVKRVSFDGRNLGFGAALNRAVLAHGTGPVILLNDDAIPEPDFVEKLLAAHEQSGATMVAGVLLRPGSALIDSAGIVCDQTLTAWDYLTGEPVRRLERADDPLGPTGGAALFDRSAFERVGGFDERIFLYYEDLDLVLRMRMAGHDCRLAAEAKAVHESSATLGRKSTAKYRQTGLSRGYLLRKYGIMRHPALAMKTILSDGSAGIGQLVMDRTAAGTTGRLDGWRKSQGIEQLEPPYELLEPAKLRRHLVVRLRRRRF